MMVSVVSGSRGQTLSLRGVDPETCMIVFKNHWAQVLRILEKHEPTCNGGHLRSRQISGDEASAVQNYVEHMLFLLTEEECGEGGAMGPILEFVLLENVMERLFVWSLRRDFTEAAKLEQLCMYEMLVTRARQPLLHHKPILCPFVMLLSSCGSSSSSAAVEAELVRLLHRLCCMLARDDTALQLFLFQSGQDQGSANFLLFSLLLPFVHHDGPVGVQARDALALITALSMRDIAVANHITQNTYFCPVLATGLSGLYSWLPAKLEVYGEGWHCFDEADWMKVPSLVQFLNSLKFCSSVCKVAHHSVRDQLLGYIYNGFLVPVLAPALHKSTLEEVVTTTAYLDLFLRHISDPTLLQTFLIFILKHRHDNVNILDTLVSRINTPFQLGTVSLALFRTLIGLYCEDVMLQLILRYLIPCSHLQSNRRCRLRERDCYSSSAAAFLSLTPLFLMAGPCTSPTLPLKPDYILWSKVTEGLLMGNTGFEDLFLSVDTFGNSRWINSEPLMYQNYLQYLSDARSMISTSVQACRVWSAPYDGLDPSPDDHQVEEEGLEDRDRDENECPPLSTPTLQPPSMHHTSLSQTPELEWDDSYDAASDGQENQNFHLVEHPQPPQHIQDMRKSAIMLIRGSYIEESEFQDDVLVYNLIAQRDARDEQDASLSSPNGKTIQTEKNNTQLYTSSSTQSDINNKVHDNQQPDEASLLLNGHADEKNLDRLNDTSAHVHQSESTVSEQQVFSEDASNTSSVGHTAEDFISQCFQHIEWDNESMLGDNVYFRRLTMLLYDEEPEIDFNSICTNDEEHGGKRDEGEGQRDGDGTKRVPFTGPFISVLLSRLENMLENSVEVNLLVTGILAQLAAYPQPLLRCFLLNTQAVFPTGVRSLYQVLVSVGCQIEHYASSRPGFPQMVRDVAQYLLFRDEALKDRERDFLQENGLGWVLDGHVSRRLLKSLPQCPKIPPQSRNSVFATFLYAEFLKELGAIAQEHSIRPD
ncbi:FHF complex subunit HOOK interacting protein 1A [Tachysurus fulvidraco]|uniref:FHF complex subunit HOOK interacting protein 1A n=1 Tax=Tachysurus fulvidraco TaxID=1234273 RepID=UPI001FEFD399|nr:FHF complex subunit HOOK interacting protein 1A [Tachysurus fulvidraco]XP_027000684.2 FHF complex subunit HOOK interacting protein 1A [Tachysurus fulvidraco]XP_027000686.2 FHF complex subunit HOOK interacting protein 1A [Tachysurus fulvidraco]XP_047663007.1 FHF complex subunit HOOK interacting protein 1A [Tachysurus fulvidraco]XP_047663008.1 FHF complex subunit HOOK interacting protein 1A [Tachysurus fulvidraco]